jgi:hypothetical protein
MMVLMVAVGGGAAVGVLMSVVVIVLLCACGCGGPLMLHLRSPWAPAAVAIMYREWVLWPRLRMEWMRVVINLRLGGLIIKT